MSVTLIATLGILIVGDAAFGVSLPSQPAGFVLALVLTSAAMLSLGLLIASLARTARVAGAVGTMIFLPLMFFAGLWVPQATMSAALRRAGDDTPLGAAVSALQHSMAGQWPSASGLAILAGYTVAFGVARLAPVPLGMRARLAAGDHRCFPSRNSVTALSMRRCRVSVVLAALTLSTW